MTEIDNNTIKNLEEKSNVFVNWVDNETPINAKNLNVINDIVAQVGADIEALSLKTNELNSQLEQKAEKIDVYLKQNGININDFDESTRKTFLELQGITVNYVLGDENVTPRNTTFFDIEIGKNKFNNQNIIYGYYVDYSSGNVNSNSGYCYNKHEFIEPNAKYTLNLQAVQTSFYDINKNYISGHLSSADNMSFVTPPNAKYYISSLPKDFVNDFMIVKGDVVGNYESYKRNEYISQNHLKKTLVSTDMLENESITTPKIENGAITLEKTDFLINEVISNNILDVSKIVEGHFIDIGDGSIKENSGYSYVPVQVNEKTTYTTISGEYLYAYFNNDIFISGEVSSKAITTPQGANIMYISFPTVLKNDMYVNKGNILLSKDDYKEKCNFKKEIKGIPRVIIVSKGKDADFDNVTQAVESSNDGDIIIIKPGIYDNEIIRSWTKNISLIGFHKNSTIIRNNTGDYSKPPLEITSGALKNLTIIADKNPNGFEGTPAYAIHIENNFMENKTLEIDNCNIISHVNFAIGCGLRKGCLLDINNCRLEGYSELQGGLYVHDTDVDSMVGLQKLRVKNTEILSNSENPSAQQLVLQSMHKTGAEFNVEFINVNVRNIITGNQNYAFQDASDWKAYDRPELVPNITLSKASYGNSLSKLNYI